MCPDSDRTPHLPRDDTPRILNQCPLSCLLVPGPTKGCVRPDSPSGPETGHKDSNSTSTITTVFSGRYGQTGERGGQRATSSVLDRTLRQDKIVTSDQTVRAPTLRSSDPDLPPGFFRLRRRGVGVPPPTVSSVRNRPRGGLLFVDSTGRSDVTPSVII